MRPISLPTRIGPPMAALTPAPAIPGKRSTITPQNVGSYKLAWTFRAVTWRSPGDPAETTYEVTPLKVDQTLYLCTPHDLVFALTAETGQQVWRYDPKIRQPPAQSTQHLTCRGLSYFDGDGDSGIKAGSTPSSGECGRRLFLPTVDGRLIAALDAGTGKTCRGVRRSGRGGGPLAKHAQRYARFVLFNVASGDCGGARHHSRRRQRQRIDTFRFRCHSCVRCPDRSAGLELGQPQPRRNRAYCRRPSLFESLTSEQLGVSSYDPKLGLVYVPMGNQSPDHFAGESSNT